MSISPRSGAWRLQRLICLKYYNVLKKESKFTLRLNAAESTDYIKKFLKQNFLSIKFFTKKSVGAYVYLGQEWSSGASKIDMFEILWCTETGK